MKNTAIDRTIVITGASGGVGTALVRQLLLDGYRNIACQYRENLSTLKPIFEMHSLPVNKHCFSADLTDESNVVAFGRHVMSEFSHVWGIVNLVGASTNSMCWKLSLNDFKDVIDTNVVSTFLTCREFIPQMRSAEGGRIINTSSVVASSGAVGVAHYCAAKAAIEGMTRAMALELANKNVTVNALGLGYCEFGLIESIPANVRETIKSKTPLGRFGHASDVSGAVKFLLSDESSFITGQVLHVNGGFHL